MSAGWPPGHVLPPDSPVLAEDRRAGGPWRRRRIAAPAGDRGAGLGWTGLDGVGPGSVEVAPRFLRLGDGYAATLAVTAYPDEVSAGWLEPLLAHPGQIDVAVHVEPVPAGVAADRLRRQRARLESSRRADAGKGRLDDPELEAAAEDAADLAHRIARGQARLFRTGLYVTVHAGSEAELAEQVAAVRTLVDSLLMQAQPATWRTVQGWVTTLPLGLDQLGMSRTFDTQALASSFPFTSPDLTPPDPVQATRPDGVFYGLNLAGTGPVLWDRWAQDTANSVTIARSGAGKSYLTKLEVLRSLYRGVEACVVDPEDEYAQLTTAVGGAYLPLAIDGAHLNPFDLPQGAGGQADAVVRRALFAHTFISVLLGEKLTGSERAVLDAAISAAYQSRGITADPATWQRPAPLLGDLAGILRDHARQHGRAGQDAASLAARLAPFCEGAHAGVFDQPTSVHPDGHLITFSLRDLPEELKAAGTLLVLDLIWRRVTSPASRRPRLVVVDEAWLLLREDDGARWLWRMAKSARKHWCGLAVVTQDAADVLSSDLGRAVVANSATQILLRQAPQAAAQVAAEFGLSAGEREFLLTAQPGDALLLAGNQRAAFHALASPVEHQLITTDPAELAALDDDAGPDFGSLPAPGAGEPEDW
jgi:type IV secretory pathway VirB4 component